MAGIESDNKGTKLKFFVYVVESPSPENLYENQFEHDLIAKAASLDSIPCEHHFVVNKRRFEFSLNDRLIKASGLHEGFPIIHISAHGDTNGLWLTSGERVDWAMLKDILVPINKAPGGCFIM